MTVKKIKPAKHINSEELYDLDDIQDIYQSAFSSYGAKDTDYDDIDFDTDNYAYQAY